MSFLFSEQLVAFIFVSPIFLQLKLNVSPQMFMNESMPGTYRITHLPGIYQQGYYLQKSRSCK